MPLGSRHSVVDLARAAAAVIRASLPPHTLWLAQGWAGQPEPGLRSGGLAGILDSDGIEIVAVALDWNLAQEVRDYVEVAGFA